MKSIESTSSQAASVRHPIVKVAELESHPTDDLLVVEEPLEVQIQQQIDGSVRERTISITMRTPGNDEELALGFLLGEGIIRDQKEVLSVSHCGPPSPDKGYQNVVQVRLSSSVQIEDSLLSRNFYTSSSCGVCGKTSIEAVELTLPAKKSSSFTIATNQLTKLPNRLRQWQTEFKRTGGIHASAIFDQQGKILRVREDVGRHNALDKLVGSYFLESETNHGQHGLLLSGRASFELIQKASMASLPLVAAIGSPSNLAVELAAQQGITLLGFLRESGFNNYTGSNKQIL